VILPTSREWSKLRPVSWGRVMAVWWLTLSSLTASRSIGLMWYRKKSSANRLLVQQGKSRRRALSGVPCRTDRSSTRSVNVPAGGMADYRDIWRAGTGASRRDWLHRMIARTDVRPIETGAGTTVHARTTVQALICAAYVGLFVDTAETPELSK